MARVQPPGAGTLVCRVTGAGRPYAARVRRTRTPALVVAGLLALAGFVGPTAWSPAGAHTEVLRADPAPGAVVTGPVDEVSLTFLDPVQPGVTIAVTAELGDPVAGVGAVEVGDGGRQASVSFPAITAEGEYVVEYRFTAEDGDTQRETYRFRIEGGPEDGADRDEADGAGAGALIGGGAVAVAVVAGAVVSLRRRR